MSLSTAACHADIYISMVPATASVAQLTAMLRPRPVEVSLTAYNSPDYQIAIRCSTIGIWAASVAPNQGVLGQAQSFITTAITWDLR